MRLTFKCASLRQS